jgi:hypothetical protein
MCHKFVQKFKGAFEKVTDGINVARDMDQLWALVINNKTSVSVKFLNISTPACYLINKS